MKKNKIHLIVLFTIFLIIGIPIIINFGYTIPGPLVTQWCASDELEYYGSFLSFAGTVALGCLALWQNHKINIKSENDSKRILDMQKKRESPIILICFIKSSVNFRNIKFSITNYSEFPALNLKIHQLRLYTKSTEQLNKAKYDGNLCQLQPKVTEVISYMTSDINDLLHLEMILEYNNIYNELIKLRIKAFPIYENLEHIGFTFNYNYETIASQL